MLVTDDMRFLCKLDYIKVN